jgi:hypothetical protein
MDLRPSFSAVLDAFSQPATVTPPGGPAVSTKAVWLPSKAVEVPSGVDIRHAESRRILALPKADVPQIPKGTIVHVAEADGQAAVNWMIDPTFRNDPTLTADVDHWKVLVYPA